MHSTKTDEEIIESFQTFENDKMSFILSTVDAENTPLTSYAPFIKHENDYFIAISSKLPHFTNMMQAQKAHVLIIEDEAKANNIYARKRLYFNVTCSIENDTEKIFSLFDTRYGDELSFLRDMPDFKVFRLVAGEKSLVLGFGAAYKMNTDGSLVQKSIQHK